MTTGKGLAGKPHAEDPCAWFDERDAASRTEGALLQRRAAGGAIGCTRLGRVSPRHKIMARKAVSRWPMACAFSVLGLSAYAAWNVVIPEREPSGVWNVFLQAKVRLDEALKEGGTQGDGTIYLGAEFARRAGFSTEGFSDFENAVAEKDGNVYLFGNDRSGRPALRPAPSSQCVMPSVIAMTRFMETFLNVRFLMPGLTGMAVLPKAEIDIRKGYFSRSRPNLIIGGGTPDRVYGLANAMPGGALYQNYGGHSYTPSCPSGKYYKDHPEYFGLVKGARFKDPFNEVLCISHPEVRKLLVSNLVKDFDAGAEISQLGPSDTAVHCECERCHALYGTGDDWNEKFWLYHCDIARDVGRLRPGKKVCILSYGANSALPPKRFRKMPNNVVIETCDASERGLRLWDGYDVPGGFMAYIYLWGNYQRLGLTPRNSLASVSVFARRLLDNRIYGIYRCGYGELYGLEGPAYWVFNRTLIDPKTEPEAALVEYCQFAFGSSASLMRTFYETLDDRLRSMSKAGEQGCGVGAAWDPRYAAGLGPYGDCTAAKPLDEMVAIYTPEALATMERCLSRAEAKAAALPDGLTAGKIARRLKLVRIEFDYLKNMAKIANLYRAYKLNPCIALFDPIAMLVNERNALLDRLYAGPGRTMIRLDGWPEILLFGGQSEARLRTNGRSAAIIGAPLGWDTDLLREKGILPGVGCKRISVGTAFGPWQELGGHQLQRIGQKARFRARRDADALVVEVESDIHPNRKVSAFGRDGAVYGDESLDLMVDPTGTREVAYHVIWGPHDGSVYDEAFGLVTDELSPLYCQFDKMWDGDWEISNATDGGIWRSTIRIPFAMFGGAKPAAGDVWCFNLGREWDIACHGRPPATDALWNPNLESPTFSSLAAMGELVFE